MGCETVWSDSSQAFQRNLLPLSSGSNSKTGKEPARNRQQYIPDFVFDPEEGSNKFVLTSMKFGHTTLRRIPQYIAVYSLLCGILIQQ
jgi:hypothetical protein